MPMTRPRTRPGRGAVFSSLCIGIIGYRASATNYLRASKAVPYANADAHAPAPSPATDERVQVGMAVPMGLPRSWTHPVHAQQPACYLQQHFAHEAHNEAPAPRQKTKDFHPWP